MDSISEKYNISAFYAYHQIRISEDTIEFGWIDVEELDLSSEVVLSLGGSGKNSAATLEDYNSFFLRLTSMLPEDFLDKWSDSIRELSLFWSEKHPKADGEQHLFILDLARLLSEFKPFERYGHLYSIVSCTNQKVEL